MHTKDSPIDQGRNVEIVKQIATIFPNIGISIFLLAFIYG